MSNNVNSCNVDLSLELSKIAREVDRARHTISSIEARAKGESGVIPEATAKVTDINKILFDAAETLLDFFDKSLEDQHKGLGFIDELNVWIKSLPEEEQKKGSPIADKIAQLLTINKDGLNNSMPIMGFQDLAGQRLKKLTGELYDIEFKILNIALTLGVAIDDHEKALIEDLRDNSLPMIIRQDKVDEILDKFGV